VINLTAAGQYDVVVEYYERVGGATMRWLWKTPGPATFVPVPAIALFN
jgi:hypothetical protein